MTVKQIKSSQEIEQIKTENESKKTKHFIVCKHPTTAAAVDVVVFTTL